MGFFELVAFLAFAGSLFSGVALLVIILLTLWTPEIGAFFVLAKDPDKKRIYGTIVYTLGIVLVLIVFSVSTILYDRSMFNAASIYDWILLFLLYFIIGGLGISLFYFPITGSYVAYRVFKKMLPVRTEGKIGIAEPVQDPEVLARELMSKDPSLRNKAAAIIRDMEEPMWARILPVCDKRYKSLYLDLHQSMSIQDRYDPDILSGKIFDKIPATVLFPYRSDHLNWVAALEGAKLSLTVSSESVEKGLLELLQLLSKEPTSSNKLQSQYLLKLCGNELVEPLLTHLKDPRPEIREWTLSLLPVFEDVRTWEPIRKALDDDNLRVRTAAADAIRLLKIPFDSGPKQVIKEIVKIPCKYCGTYCENTNTTCQSCGAPLK